MAAVDFAGTFPAEACAKSMLRKVTLRNGKVTIRDSYELTESKIPADFNWLTWGDKVYRVTLRERKASPKGSYVFTLSPEKTKGR